MYKYVKFNEDTGLCTMVGDGTNDKFYQSIGMVYTDVEKSEVDGNWYLKELCPHYTEEEISQQKDEQETEQELLSLENALKELKNLYLQAQILGDNDTMTDVTAQIKELLEITEEQAEIEESNGNNIEE